MADGIFLSRSSACLPPWCDKEWKELTKLVYDQGSTNLKCNYAMKPRKWPYKEKIRKTKKS